MSKKEETTVRATRTGRMLLAGLVLSLVGTLPQTATAEPVPNAGNPAHVGHFAPTGADALNLFNS